MIMGDRASAERACKDQNPIIDGRKANVNLAILGAKPRGNVQAGECEFLFIFIFIAIFHIRQDSIVHIDETTNKMSVPL